MPELVTVRAYHQRSKHSLQAYAAGPQTLDWDNQPDPWRLYAGAPLLQLPLPAHALATSWAELHRPGSVPAQPLDLSGLATLLQLSLGLSAWKQQGPDRWAVRCNPSSGNLHPTEAYVIAQGLGGLDDGLYHYAPRQHALERRASLTGAAALGSEAGPALWLGLSSIHWREAWKYGERAFRYCQLDLGHALGGLRYAAAALGWQLLPVSGLDAAALARALGLDRAGDFGTAEAEEPECLLQLRPLCADAQQALALRAPPAQGWSDWAGQANRLDRWPMYRWPVIDEVAQATRRGLARPRVGEPAAPAGLAAGEPAAPSPRAADLIRQRRSAQRFDRRASMSAATLAQLVAALQPDAGLPWDAWPWPAQVHAVFFVHRVDGFTPGAYVLPRGDGAQARLAAALSPALLWQPVAGTPLLRLADNPALAGTLRTLCCHQALAADANLAVAMLGEFDAALAGAGPAGYRHLLQEAGLLGQVLYLQAEAAGHRGTGIGCFFDDALHELLGITGTTLQSLYHFTVGSAVADGRIGDEPPYPADRLTPEPRP